MPTIRRNKGKWFSATQAQRRRKIRSFTLSSACHDALTHMADLTGHSLSAVVEACVRIQYETVERTPDGVAAFAERATVIISDEDATPRPER